MKIAIISLGCPKNQVDADVFCHALIKDVVPFHEMAEQGGVALGRSSHVQRHGRVGKGHGQGVSVQQQVVQIAVLQGFLYRAVSRRGRVLALPRIVPQA